MLTYVPNSGLFFTLANGVPACRCTLIDTEVPISLEITGEDVDGLNNDIVISAGSSLLTPTKNYIAYEHGVFTEVNGSSSGPSVPTPTAQDEGKAIVVNNSGEYALDNVGGDQEPLIVTVLSGPSGYTADKTATEIYDAFTANRQVLCVWQNFFFYPSAPPTQDDAFFEGFRTTGDNVVANIFTGFNKYIVHVSNNLGVMVTVREYKPSTSK